MEAGRWRLEGGGQRVQARGWRPEAREWWPKTAFKKLEFKLGGRKMEAGS